MVGWLFFDKYIFQLCRKWVRWLSFISGAEGREWKLPMDWPQGLFGNIFIFYCLCSALVTSMFVSTRFYWYKYYSHDWSLTYWDRLVPINVNITSWRLTLNNVYIKNNIASRRWIFQWFYVWRAMLVWNMFSIWSWLKRHPVFPFRHPIWLLRYFY